MVEAKAAALVCGRSWALQRYGELEKARMDVERSLELGKTIESVRNKALCLQSFGTLHHLQAKRSSQDRSTLFATSVAVLNEAVRHFLDLHLEREAGETYLLLAQTCLSAGDFWDAHEALRQAERLLRGSEPDGRVETALVRGDLAKEEGRFDDALAAYGDAVAAAASIGSEQTATRAYAVYCRGLARLDKRLCQDARLDFEAAVSTYCVLGDLDQAAFPELELMRLSGELPGRHDSPYAARLFEAESPLVQVAAIRAHRVAVRQDADLKAALALRADPPREHWRRMIERGRQEVARRRPSW